MDEFPVQYKELGNISELVRDLSAIFKLLQPKRKLQLGALFILQIIGAMTEVVSIGAVMPFLGALANAEAILKLPQLQYWLRLVGVDSASSLIILMASLFAGSVVLANFMRVLTLWAQSRLGAVIGSDLSIEIFRKVLFKPYKYHTRINSGILISIVTHDLNTLLSVVRNFLSLMTHGMVVIAIFTALISYDAKTALTIAVVLFGLYMLFAGRTKSFMLNNGKIISDKHGSMIKILQEGLGGIRDIILDGSQKAFINIYTRAERSMRSARARSTVVVALPRYMLEVIGVLVLCGYIGYYAYNGSDLQKILPVVGGCVMAALRLLPAMQKIYSSFASTHGAHIAMKRVLEVLLSPMPTAPLLVSDQTMVHELRQSLLLEDVWFKYDDSEDDNKNNDSEWVLKGINMEIKSNTTVALVGKTGSGKSTIADIVLGLLRPQEGCVKIDGEKLTDNSIHAWRKNIAHVPQHIYLSDATIKENIAFGIPDKKIDLSRVKEAARMACIDEFICNCKLGYDQRIGERGIKLSGGQRQRIGIARALYKNASVIVFDEATSALDNSTEAALMEAIANLSGNKTMLLIAHRLSTVRTADKIYEIANGCVISQGKYDDLLVTSKTFSDMVYGKS